VHRLHYDSMLVRPQDLTAAARIRQAALEGFARSGVASTSLRDVARAAGVSPGLVQHHYRSKAALREAVDQYVIEVAAAALEGLEEVSDPEDLIAALGDRLTLIVREHHHALLYVARGAAEGDESALKLFDAFVALADEQIKRLDEAGLVRNGIDLRWAALHAVVGKLGTALFEPAINRHLETPWRTPEQLERWNRAGTDSFRWGVIKPEAGAVGVRRKPARRPARSA
jgi:AcrR family transcriptional regulator